MTLEENRALDAFAALSQETRLRMVRAFVAAGGDGMSAGAVAEAVGVSSSSASFHLAHLERSGLAHSRRESRSIIYTANITGLSALVEFLMQDCCQGHPEICVPALNAVSCCTPSPEKENA